MTLWFFVFLWALLSLCRDALGTVCSDAVTNGTTVLKMCEDGNVVGKRVVIDTYESSQYRKDGGSINCSCTATVGGLSDGTSTTVDFGPVQSLYPPSGCRSVVALTPQLEAFPQQTSTFSCFVSNFTSNAVKNNDTFTVLWQSGLSGSTSYYCLMLEAGVGSSLSLKCNPSLTPTRSPTTATSTPPPVSSNTIIQTSVTITTSITSSTTASPTTLLTTTNGGGTTVSSTKSAIMTEETTTKDPNNEKLDMPVIIAIAVGGVVFLVICIIIAVLYSRSKVKRKEPRETGSAMHNSIYDTRRIYLPDTEIRHIVTPGGDIYAQVEKDSNVETVIDSNDLFHEQEQEIEHVVTPSGDIYAQVEKESKMETGIDSNDLPLEAEEEIEHVVTPSGDIYAQVQKTTYDNVYL